MSRVLTHALVRAGVSANAISIAGMLCGIASGIALVMSAYASPIVSRILWLLSAGLIQLRLLANMLDGMVAIESGKVSAVGEMYNDLPDRVSDSATLIGLGYAGASLGAMPIALGYLAALLAMATSYVRAVGKGAGAGSDFSGPMAKPHRMFIVTLCAILCAATPVSWRDPTILWTLWLLVAGSALTAIRRTIRIASKLQSKGPTP